MTALIAPELSTATAKVGHDTLLNDIAGLCLS